MAALLLDEKLPRSTARLLTQAGHDVALVVDACPAAPDEAVLAQARGDGRVLVSFDADFGDLVYRRGHEPPLALVYLRLHPIDGEAAAALVLQALAEPIAGQFVVCTRQGLRRRPLPPAGRG